MDTTIETIRDGILATMSTVLGAGFSEMPYVNDPLKNNFRGNNDRYGTRQLAANQTPGVTRYMTFEQTFEIVLSKSYYQSSIGDSGARSAALELSGLMNDIHKELINTKAGAPAVVLHVNQLDVEEPQFVEESKFVLLKGQVLLQWRINLI